MISQMCEAGLASSMEDALHQDVDLANEIMHMRYFAYVYDEYKRDQKTLTPEREKYMEWIETISG